MTNAEMLAKDVDRLAGVFEYLPDCTLCPAHHYCMSNSSDNFHKGKTCFDMAKEWLESEVERDD